MIGILLTVLVAALVYLLLAALTGSGIVAIVGAILVLIAGIPSGGFGLGAAGAAGAAPYSRSAQSIEGPRAPHDGARVVQGPARAASNRPTSSSSSSHSHTRPQRFSLSRVRMPASSSFFSA